MPIGSVLQLLKWGVPLLKGISFFPYISNKDFPTQQTFLNYLSRGNMSTTVISKPYLKETRNLSDKNCVLEMMKNVATFLNDAGFPECHP